MRPCLASGAHSWWAVGTKQVGNVVRAMREVSTCGDGQRVPSAAGAGWASGYGSSAT